MIQCVRGVAACVARVWQRFFVEQRGSPQGLRDVHGNKTGSNTTNTSDAKAQPRATIINDLVLQWTPMKKSSLLSHPKSLSNDALLDEQHGIL